MDVPTPQQIDYEQSLYEMFFLTGAICTALTGGLIVAYIVMPSMRKHPNPILLNILAIQFVTSLKYFVTGGSFKLHHNNIEYTPKSLVDFGLIHYGCKLEGFLAYLLFVYIIIWNLCFTYDVYLTVNRPLSFSENYMFKYNMFVYVFGTMFSVTIFYMKIDFFTDSSIYICYIKSGFIYDVYVNFPILACFAVIVYVLVKYTGASRYGGYSKNKFRIEQILYLHRLYFILWSFFNFLNMVFDIAISDSPYISFVQSLCMSLKPIDI